MSDDKRVAYKDLDDDGKRESLKKLKDSATSAEEKFSKGSYYSWSETIDDIKHASGAGKTAVAGTKLVGKSLFNIGKFALAEILPGILKTAVKKEEENLKNKK